MVDFLTVTPATLPTIVQGDDYTVTVTLTKDCATYCLCGATVTASIHDAEHPSTGIINDHAVTITTAACGIVTLTLLDTETDGFRVNMFPNVSRMHFADFKVVQSCCAEAHSELVYVPVRRAVT